MHVCMYVCICVCVMRETECAFEQNHVRESLCVHVHVSDMADVCVVIKKPNVMYVYMHVTKKNTLTVRARLCALMCMQIRTDGKFVEKRRGQKKVARTKTKHEYGLSWVNV
jgi:hypothetical protein